MILCFCAGRTRRLLTVVIGWSWNDTFSVCLCKAGQHSLVAILDIQTHTKTTAFHGIFGPSVMGPLVMRRWRSKWPRCREEASRMVTAGQAVTILLPSSQDAKKSASSGARAVGYRRHGVRYIGPENKHGSLKGTVLEVKLVSRR